MDQYHPKTMCNIYRKYQDKYSMQYLKRCSKVFYIYCQPDSYDIHLNYPWHIYTCKGKYRSS